jgi:cyclic pyranopterin phosphate synthase
MAFTHFDEQGASRMVDVGGKEVSARRAVASGRVTLQPATVQRIKDQGFSKGNVLEVARLAGIMAAKRTAEWIPLCHTLPLDSAAIDFEFAGEDAILIRATIGVTARTGVEMEALVAVSAAALTIYDMCKSADRSIVIGEIRLEEKSGGRSGEYVREADDSRKVQQQQQQQ